ncbi:response regulator transcription factor [Rhodohalobacter sp. 614A]|uniref:response regulator transcription factor n=1 Tax=Rhodohalobacter sp. 614A TaxID=2908649 RepID=UPI001F2F436A|nr:response regulator transcription factor [Rhodohalobacter sp. 614A]
MEKLEGLKILVVEDDPTVRLLVRKALENHGATISEADSAKNGETKALQNEYDMIVLDLRLPDGTGYDVCVNLRDQNVTTPILVLSAEQETNMKVKVLNVGADDYLTKPFSVEELLARIEAIMRRSISQGTESELECYEMKIDLIKRKMIINDAEVDLTNSEFNLLVYLVRNRGRTVSQEELAKNVWGIGFNTQTNYINVYISYLRKKIRKHSDFEYIRTIRKKGFKIVCGPKEKE